MFRYHYVVQGTSSGPCSPEKSGLRFKAYLHGWPEGKGAVPPAEDGWDCSSPFTRKGSHTFGWRATCTTTQDGGEVVSVKRGEQAMGERPCEFYLC